MEITKGKGDTPTCSESREYEHEGFLKGLGNVPLSNS